MPYSLCKQRTTYNLLHPSTLIPSWSSCPGGRRDPSLMPSVQGLPLEYPEDQWKETHCPHVYQRVVGSIACGTQR
ncbi:uncharacterized protein BDW43DRAFT_288272 [Aspergillus alliaceus]|uniref:uncharacterized protein n=1 Tax=Petromyces alliaceus TaxID=209559 RepID=UPI0012A4475E|nr:uncharacterized protein BDW43DRAFT_288272 [Aspergillus alliaceus]KAB8229378.1 hypothetical protein BDW43DRAFT_288272 [Aspergillus alliaceus]